MTFKAMTGFVQRSDRKGPTWAAASASVRQQIGDGTTVSEAFRLMGLDYTIVKAPMVAIYVDPNTGKRSAFPSEHVELIRTPREDGGQPIRLGDPVKANYGLIQNMELATMLDPLTKTWPIETAGEFTNGTTVYTALKSEGKMIGGDETNNYFLVSDTRDGGTAVDVCFTSVRVVCWNTLQMALRSGVMRVKLSHTADVKRDAEFFIEIMGKLRIAEERAQEFMAAMADTRISDEQVKTIINAALPIREKPAKLVVMEGALGRDGRDTRDLSKIEVQARMEQFEAVQSAIAANGAPSVEEMTHAWETMRDRVQAQRTVVRDVYANEREAHPDVSGNSLWLVVQAIVENADWRTDSESDSRAEQTLFGRRADEKTRALRAAEEFMVAGRR